MNDIQLFQNPQFGQIRVIDRDGNPWFVATDICKCLDISNTSMALERLDDDEKSNISLTDIGSNTGVYDTSNGGKAPTIVSEPGLYSLVLGSRKPEAKAFKRWITHDVIPSIRKTGAYQLAPKTYVEALRALAAEVEQKEQAMHERDAAIGQRDAAIGQRDEAIRTKAHFVEGRDAEMCGRVGGLTKANENLREQLGNATNWKQAKAIPWLKKYFNVREKPFYSQLGKVLTKISNSMGIETRTVEDSTWGCVKAYHITVIEQLKVLLDSGEDILPDYRRWVD